MLLRLINIIIIAKNNSMRKILSIILVTLAMVTTIAQQEDITVTNLAVRPSTPEICATVEVEVVVRVLGTFTNGYNNANHLSSVAILLPGFYYTRAPQDGTGDTPVNNETNFDTQITVSSSDGNVYWHEPYIVGDHEVQMDFLENAVIPFGTNIFLTVSNMEIDDAQDVWSNTVEATIEHVAVDYDPDNDLKSVPTETQACTALPCTAQPLVGTPATTYVGISTLDRNVENWLASNPDNQLSAYIALESSNKPFVVTRMQSPETQIPVNSANAVEGMVVWDTDQHCLKMYKVDGTGNGAWSCITNQCNP